MDENSVDGDLLRIAAKLSQREYVAFALAARDLNIELTEKPCPFCGGTGSEVSIYPRPRSTSLSVDGCCHEMEGWASQRFHDKYQEALAPKA